MATRGLASFLAALPAACVLLELLPTVQPHAANVAEHRHVLLRRRRPFAARAGRGRGGPSRRGCLCDPRRRL
eukprot:7333445-Lingulodinium_polyedra.AAC.1